MTGLESDRLLIRNLCSWAKLAPSVVASRARLTPSTVTRAFSGTSPNRLSFATLQKLRSAFPTFPGWREDLALDPAHVAGSADAGGEVSAERREAAEQLGLAMIPELVDYAYGLGGTYTEEFTEVRQVPFRQDWLARLTPGVRADVFLTPGRGDSMAPTIDSGDDVLVNRAENVIDDQDLLWAVAYGQIGTIKRVRRLPTGIWQLNSDNKIVPPMELTDDEIYVVGRVIWIGKRK